MADVKKQMEPSSSIRPEVITENQAIGLEVVDGHAVKAPADYQDPEELYQILINKVKTYHPSEDVSMIEKAYKIAKEAHKGQFRKSGEAYIIHPLWVAIILANLELDKETIVAGILHDVVEDTVMTDEEIRKEFGDEVALLVDGVTKLGQLSYSADKLEVQAENLRKMFLAMAKDIRVVIIKLADRLHNMRTLQFMRPEKQKEKARETMDIYAPIAQRLGISRIKTELDDLSLKYLKPEVFYDLVDQINARKTEREEFIQQIVEEVSPTVSTAVTINMIITGAIARMSNTGFTGISFGISNQLADATLSQFSTHALVNSTPSAVTPVVGRTNPMINAATYPTMIPIRMEEELSSPFPVCLKIRMTTSTRIARNKFSADPKSFAVLPPPKEFTPTPIRLSPIESTTVPVTTDGKNLLNGFRKNPRTVSNRPPRIDAPMIAP